MSVILQGWLPASSLARAHGVSPSTVRRRALRGLLDRLPNPYGPGGLYRENGGGRYDATFSGSEGRTKPDDVSSRDVLVLHQLPGSVTRVARSLGVSKGSVDRSLRRLREAGLAERGEALPSGGRPEIVWRAV